MSEHKAGKFLSEKALLLKLGALQYRYMEMLQAAVAPQSELLRQLQLIAHQYAVIAERRTRVAPFIKSRGL
jgi:hypothetical protein